MSGKPDSTSGKTYLVADLKHRRAEDLKSVHANSANFAANFYDVALIFGQIVPQYEDEPIIEDKVSITMSWEHLKALGDGIQQIIANYERDHHTTVRSKPLKD